MSVGKKLRILREQAGLTQKQVAEQIGVTNSVISYYELQSRSPSPEILKKFSSIFHVTCDYLLGIERKKLLDISDLNPGQERMILVLLEQMRKEEE